jgi:iron(III) transport system permease protein
MKTIKNWDAQKAIFLSAVGIVVFLVCVPCGFLLWESFTDKAGSFTLANYPRYLVRPNVVEAVLNTLVVSISISAAGCLLGVAMAFGVSRTNMLGKGLVKSAVVISVMTPPFLLTLAYIILGGPNEGLVNKFLRWLLSLATTHGPINIFSLWSLVILGLPMGTAIIFLMAFPALENMDPYLEEAARITGGSAWRSAIDVTIRVIKPAIFSGMILAFGQTVAMYGVPRMLNINVLTLAIRESLVIQDFKLGAVLSVTTTGLSLLAVFLYRHSMRSGKRYNIISSRGFRPAAMKLGKSRHVFTAIGMAYAVFAFILPYTILLAVSFMKSLGMGFSADNLSFRNYVNIFNSASNWNAFKNSLTLAFGTSTIVVAVGLIIAFILTRTSIRRRAWLEYLCNLPMGISGTALAMGLIFMYLTYPLNILKLYGTLGILLIAYCTRQLPSGVRYGHSSLLQISKELEEASRVAGAGWLKTIAKITIPLVRNGMFYAWILAFINVFPELSASSMLRNSRTPVVATAILELWDGAGGLPQAAAFGSIVFLLVAGLVAFGQTIVGGSMLDRQKRAD